MYSQYEGGSVTGAASNSSEAAKTAHAFMIQSLLSAHKNIAHILPVSNIEAVEMHEALKKHNARGWKSAAYCRRSNDR